MFTKATLSIVLVAVLTSLFVAPTCLPAQDEDKAPAVVDELAIQQGVVADKYARLEKLLYDMARIEQVSNPRRASLLMQALKQSKEKLTVVKLNAIVKQLNQEKLDLALENQRDAHKDMIALLQLLLSESRSDRNKKQQELIREYIKEVQRIKRLQSANQGRTEGGAPMGELAKDQGKIADRTDQLAKRIQENEEGGAQGEGKPTDEPKNAGDGKGKGKGKGKGEGEGKGKGEGEGDGKGKGKGEGEGKGKGKGEGEGEGKGKGKGEGEGEGKGKGKGEGEGEGKGKGQGGEGGEDGQQQKQDENPARKRIEEAEERMREAKQRLEEAKRKESVAEQEKAKEKLDQALAELERILRQLREEEIERMLALLEARFRKMLQVQLRIYEDTVRLDKIAEAERDLKIPIPAGKLATDERKLVIDADKALNLLIEEGSSIAFPETVEQMRDDMQQVADRLDEAKVERITQSIEEDIIAALEEMIEALQKAQQEMEESKSKPPPPSPSQPQDKPLVDKLAELKMVRALQMRINTRTKRYARLLDDIDDPVGQASDADLQDAIVKLSERQARIYQITRDLVLGKNQ